MVLEAPTDGVASAVWRTQEVPCNLCGGTDFTTRYPSTLTNRPPLEDLCACTTSKYGVCGPIVQCDGCGLVMQNPQPVPEDLLAAYGDVVDLRYDQEREGRVHTFRRSLRELAEHAQPGRLLDVGAHLGVFVDVAREDGWEAQGVEPSRWAAETAQARGLPVRQGSLEEVGSIEAFDAVTLWDVIEHLADPLGSLKHIHTLLRPGGIVAMSTMDVDAPVARAMGRRWPWYMQMHLYYFSRESLRRLVEQAGFEVIEIRRHRRIVSIGYLVSRLEGRVGALYPWLEKAARVLGIERRLVGVDLGDIVTLFARKPRLQPRPSTNGAHA